MAEQRKVVSTLKRPFPGIFLLISLYSNILPFSLDLNILPISRFSQVNVSPVRVPRSNPDAYFSDLMPYFLPRHDQLSSNGMPFLPLSVY